MVVNAETEELAFCGVHVLSQKILGRLDDTSAFPIIATYLRLASEGEKVVGWRADAYYWRDLGTEASLQQAVQDIEQNVIGR